jgi:hypothetical protein
MRSQDKRIKKQLAKNWVHQYKVNHSACADCGVSYPPYVLDFDHLKDKSFGISRALQLGLELDKIKQEVKKCEIVCANCHRIRTYNRSIS